MRRRLLVLLAGFYATEAFAVDDLGRAAETLGNLEARVVQLEKESVNPVAKSSFYPIERRLLDAELNFSLENYAKAAVLYLDARQNAAFPTHPERLQILSNLGTSLLKIRNFQAAKDTFEELVQLGPSPVYDSALRSLVEIALTTRSGAGLREVVEKLGTVQGRGPGSQYAYGKGLVRLGRYTEAASALSTVLPGSDEYVSAQYYLGVALVELKRLPEARVAFANVAAAAADKPELLPQVELARLAQGRLLLELGQWEAAANEYAEIPRTSPHYHQALFEITWAYVNAEELDKALNALDLLLLTVEDDKIATEAHILRGRLNTQLDRTESASEAYAEVLLRFRPLREELDTFSQDRDGLRKYFRFLLARHDDAMRTQSGLSDRALAWIKQDPELSVLLGLLDDLSIQRDEIVESRSILEELEAVLADGVRIEAFPNLRSAWTRIVITKNELTRISVAAIEAKASGSSPTGDAAQLLNEARQLAQQLGDAPVTAQEYEANKDGSRRELSELRREAFRLDQAARGIKEELGAVESWLDEERFRGPGPGVRGGQKEVQERLEASRRRYENLARRLDLVDSRIVREEARVGAGDRTERDTDGDRTRLMALHQQLDGLLSGASGGNAQLASELRGRVALAMKRLDRVAADIARAASERSGEFKTQLDAERILIEGYSRTIAAFEQDSDRLAREVGGPLFQSAKGRLDDVVLEADIGVVDIAYKRKQRESERIATLQKERGDTLQAIEETMESLRRVEP